MKRSSVLVTIHKRIRSVIPSLGMTCRVMTKPFTEGRIIWTDGWKVSFKDSGGYIHHELTSNLQFQGFGLDYGMYPVDWRDFVDRLCLFKEKSKPNSLTPWCTSKEVYVPQMVVGTLYGIHAKTLPEFFRERYIGCFCPIGVEGDLYQVFDTWENVICLVPGITVRDIYSEYYPPNIFQIRLT